MPLQDAVETLAIGGAAAGVLYLASGKLRADLTFISARFTALSAASKIETLQRVRVQASLWTDGMLKNSSLASAPSAG